MSCGSRTRCCAATPPGWIDRAPRLARRAARRSCELREEGGLDGARPDVRLRRGSRARRIRCRGSRARNCATTSKWRSSCASSAIEPTRLAPGRYAERLRRLVARGRARARGRSHDLRRLHRGALLRALRRPELPCWAARRERCSRVCTRRRRAISSSIWGWRGAVRRRRISTWRRASMSSPRSRRSSS